VCYSMRMRAWWIALACLACVACRKEGVPGERAPAPPAKPPGDAAVAVPGCCGSASTLPDVEILHRAGTRVAVSSTVANRKLPPSALVDGDPATAWNSRTGELEGAWIELAIPTAAHVARIALTVGFTRKGPEGDYFTMNPRIREVRVSRDGAELRRYKLDIESRALQNLAIDGPGGVYRIEVVAIAAGTRTTWRELCVSELEVWGALAPGADAEHQIPPVEVGSLEPPVAPDAPPDCETVGSTDVPGGTAEIEVCTVGIVQGHEDWAKEYQRTAALVRKPTGTREPIGEWSDGWEWGTKWAIAGVLQGSRGRFALLVSRASYGPSPGLSGTSVELTAHAGVLNAWPPAQLGSASALTVEVATDERSATLTWTRAKGNDFDSTDSETQTELIELKGTAVSRRALP
jgi:hypothetical protein